MKCGLLGEKLGHSYSPAIHKYLGKYSYDLFEMPLKAVGDFLTGNSFNGINVTIPYKKAVMPFCHHLTEEAQKLGAVNTIIKNKDGTLTGHNTDYFGFRSMLDHSGLNPKGKKVLVLGSGGASNTVCCVLRESGAHVVVVSRTGENNYTNVHLHSDCSIIVNTTPVGMYPHNGTSPLSLELFPQLEGVLDLIYNPGKTQLLLDAQQRGIIAENGLWMLIAQAKESAEFFTGNKIDDELIRSIYHKLQNKMQNLILIGMPGCGKSTVGKILAEKLCRNFVDADSYLEQKTGISIPDIFHIHGEEKFRALETDILAELGKGSGQVIATGGGCVTQAENHNLLRQNGVIVWLERPLDQLPTDGRPLSQAISAETMYARRQPLYAAFSDCRFQNSDTPEKVAEHIIQSLDLE